jgi:hypothetical protein
MTQETTKSTIEVTKEVETTKFVGKCEKCNNKIQDAKLIDSKCCKPGPLGNKCQGHFRKI